MYTLIQYCTLLLHYALEYYHMYVHSYTVLYTTTALRTRVLPHVCTLLYSTVHYYCTKD